MAKFIIVRNVISILAIKSLIKSVTKLNR